MTMIDALCERLAYDPEIGRLTWKFCATASKRSNRYAGQPTGCVGPWGYLVFNFTFEGRQHVLRGARVAFALMTGRWPEHEIEHVNGDRADDRWSNLREATGAQNRQNQGFYKNNKTGFRGVHRHQGRFMAQITKDGQPRYLGMFDKPEEAHARYLSERAKLFTFQPTPRDR